MSASPKIILASGSAIRAAILNNAGVPFTVVKPGVDEDVIKDDSKAAGLTLEDTAMRLAEAKALAVAPNEDGLVIGSDQILEFEGTAHDKPSTMAEARERLRAWRGKPHTLVNAVVVARGNDVLWRNLDRPTLFMRDMTDAEIDAYLDAAGEDILSSVGAYQVENLGARLFERIEGDYFAVLGMSLTPLLGCLRREGALAF
ncbi:MAG: Maf family protein [Hyphococcus sp.]